MVILSTEVYKTYIHLVCVEGDPNKARRVVPRLPLIGSFHKIWTFILDLNTHYEKKNI